MPTTDLHDPFAPRAAAILADLALLAARIAGDGRHLVLHSSVTPRLISADAPLPPGAVDARDSDAVAIAEDDPTALVVVAAGPFRGDPAIEDGRFDQLRAAGGTIATLVVSGLSGSYAGLAAGPELGWSRDGVIEEVLGTDCELVLDDGTTGVVTRTTLGVHLSLGEQTTRHVSLLEALRWLPRLPVDVRSSTFSAEELRALLVEADRLVPPNLRIVGR